MTNQPMRRGTNRMSATLWRMIEKAVRNEICALFSTKGNTMGIISAVTKFDRKVKVVMEFRFPPSFVVTTAAAAAQGAMTQHRIPSHMIFVFVSLGSVANKMMPTMISTKSI